MSLFNFSTAAAHDVNSVLKIVTKSLFSLRDIVSLIPDGSGSLTPRTVKTEIVFFGFDDLENSIFIALVESIFRMSLLNLIHCLARKKRKEYLKTLVLALVIMKLLKLQTCCTYFTTRWTMKRRTYLRFKSIVGLLLTQMGDLCMSAGCTKCNKVRPSSLDVSCTPT